MKIQCDVCERAAATVICCADEAALCPKCDVEVHAANKLASKHQRLLLHSLSNKLPTCDICQEKVAFIFCVEDRALFCRDCDEHIHSVGSLSANHQRFLATGIRVALSSGCTNETQKSCLDEPPSEIGQQIPSMKLPTHEQPPPFNSSAWAVDDLLRFSDFVSSPGKEEQYELEEFDWVTDVGVFGELPQEALAAAEVPQQLVSSSVNLTSYRPNKSNIPHKKHKIEILDDDDFFTVPDLG